MEVVDLNKAFDELFPPIESDPKNTAKTLRLNSFESPTGICSWSVGSIFETP